METNFVVLRTSSKSILDQNARSFVSQIRFIDLPVGIATERRGLFNVMSERRHYSVIGAGALGGFYGCRLQRVGHRVSFLVRSDYDHVRKHGWRVDSKDGDFTLPTVDIYRSAEELPPADTVIIGLKTTENDQLPQLLRTSMKPDGVALVLQNGIGIEEKVAEIVGRDRVIGGCCFLCCNKIGPGHIHHLDYGTIGMGELTHDGKPAPISERLQSIANDFIRAGIHIELTDDLRLARWKKLVWNIPFNGLSVLLKAETNEIVGDPDLEQVVRNLMAEIVRAAAADGRTIDQAFVEQMIAYTKVMTPYRTSMRVDYDQGRPLEIEAIFHATLQIAESLGVDLPLVESLYRKLTFIDRKMRG